VSKIITLPIYLYKFFISPVLPGTCRYYPTCSDYALEAIKHHGSIKGGFLGLKRILKCHPWGKSGFAPVPKVEGKCDLTNEKDVCEANDCSSNQCDGTA
jgi:putative membrane protein insertion efficiency factor